MKREEAVKHVLKAGATVKGFEIPATIKAVRQKARPVTINGSIVDRTDTFVRIQLPSGLFLDCRVEGTMGEHALTEILAKDPHHAPIYKAMNPKKEKLKQ